MQFKIRRASTIGFGSDSDKKPIEQAYKKNNNWYVDINSLSELLDLENEEGSIIIQDNYEWEEDGKTIIIYDDYLEG